MKFDSLNSTHVRKNKLKQYVQIDSQETLSKYF